MKRLILSIIALAVSASPLTAKIGFLEPKPSNKDGIYYHSDIISLEEGEKFEVLLAEGRSSQDFALYIYKHDSDPSSEPISDNAESYLSHRTTESLKGETLYGPLKLFNVSPADPSERPNREFRPIVQYRISAVGKANTTSFLEPKPSNKNGIYYHSDIISLEEGEKFEVLLAEGRSSQDFALYIYKHDSDPSSEPISDNAESYLSHRTTESLKGETLYGPLKLFNVSPADPSERPNREFRPIVQYRISAVEDLSLAALASGVENNAKGIETNATTIQGKVTDIAAAELAVAENSAAVSANAKTIQDNATGIAANANTLRTHDLWIEANLMGANRSLENEARLEIHDLLIEANLVGANRSLENESRLEIHDLWIEANRIAHRQSLRDIESNANANTENSTTIQGIATSIETIGTSIQDNATDIIANGTGIQDVVTSIEKIGASVQDNATSIATNGAAIAGNRTSTQEIAVGVAENGTSIQGVATGIETIAKNVQDNATGVAANATSIAGNTTSIQDNTTGVAANVMLIAGNLSKIQLINQNIEGINRDLDLGKNERGRNVLEIGKNQLRFQALENQIGSLGSDAAFIQKLGDEFATKDDLTTTISEGKTQGINAVTSDPNNWNIFTADQIQEMAVGDLVLTRQENGDFVLNFEIQQSDNAKDWTTYSAQAETITGLPVNKAFVRIRTR